MVKNSIGKQKHCTLRKRLSEVGFFLWFFRPSVLLLLTCQVCKKSCTLSRKVQREYFSFQQPTKSRVHGRTEVTTSRPHTLQTSQTNMYITSLFSVSPFENPRGWKEAVNHTRAPGRKNFEKLLRHDGCYERKKQKHLMHKKKNEAPQRPSVVTQLYRINTKTRMHVRILTGALYEIKHIMCWTSSCACSLVARLSGGTRTWTLQHFISLNCLNQINKNVFYFRFTLILKRLSSLQVARGVNALLRSTDCRVRICIQSTFLCFTHQINNQWLPTWEWQQVS